MHVLQLVTSESSFFEKQVEALETRGVTCTVVSLPSREGTTRSPRSYASLYRRVLRSATDDVDVVHVNYGLLGPIALAQPRRPVVLTLWGSEIMGAAGWLDTVSAWSARRSDAVVAPSPAVSDRLDCDHHLVPFGVDTSLFRPIPRAEAREQLGWDPDERVVLFPYPPSRTVKNYPLAESVVEDVPGDPVLKTISDVPYEDVPLFMNASDAVLVTSRRESGPMVVKEAAACNVPVVSTDVGFVDEVLDGVEHSYVCSSRTELVEGTAAALDAGRANGRERLESLGLDRMGERLLHVYRDALGQPTEVADVPA
ncbi:glycosyltransferase family 4 protein [Haloarchaeobius sp. HRN-SO-5]|uniref:glycosyltransferase family 4 protein n=1 Tax=Haloarchaeobius sp. HRN-SO-5 TaxID=3446118 RepID=UPI003EBB389D